MNCQKEFEQLLKEFNERLRHKAQSLAKSGGIDCDKYPPMLLARILLGASIEQCAPEMIPFPTQEMLEDLGNLIHF